MIPSRLNFITRRIPETIPFSAAPKKIADAELLEVEEKAEENVGRDEAEEESEPPAPGLDHDSGMPHPEVDGARTLLHPLEAAQRSRTTTPITRAVCIV